MGEVVPFIQPKPSLDPFSEDLEKREAMVNRLSVIMVDELDFVIRKMAALRGAPYALGMIEAIIKLQKLRVEPAEPTTEVPCA